MFCYESCTCGCRNVLEGASVLQQQAVASPVEKPTESLDDSHTTKTVLHTETSPPVTTVSPPQQEKDTVDEVKPLQEEKETAKEEPVSTESSNEAEDYDEPEDAEKTQNSTDSDGSEFLKVLENCRDLICIQEAHAKFPRSSDMFNFPHFMIIGFQKAATTSLKQYVIFLKKYQGEDV